MKLCVTPQLKPQFFFHLSALDAESEHLVQEALERLMKGRTVITIAHRLSTIKNADNIVVLSDGQISEAGSYMELMAEPDGLFRKLVEKQTIALQWTVRGSFQVISIDLHHLWLVWWKVVRSGKNQMIINDGEIE